jgi:hypothetical protein
MTGKIRFALIDGPALLIEIGGIRILTDPAFDAARLGTFRTKSGQLAKAFAVVGLTERLQLLQPMRPADIPL